MLSEANGAAQAIIIATGSEVAVAMDAQKTLAAEGVNVRVVSMPLGEGILNVTAVGSVSAPAKSVNVPVTRTWQP